MGRDASGIRHCARLAVAMDQHPRLFARKRDPHWTLLCSYAFSRQRFYEGGCEQAWIVIFDLSHWICDRRHMAGALSKTAAARPVDVRHPRSGCDHAWLVWVSLTFVGFDHRRADQWHCSAIRWSCLDSSTVRESA